MKVLCALGARDGAALVRRVLTRFEHEALELLLVFVIDEGSRHGIEAWHGPLHVGARLGHKRHAQMAQAEARSGEAVLAEAQAVAQHEAGIRTTTQLLHGRAERVIVELAAQVGADLAVVSAREGIRAALAGPESVGHVARYVLDHAPCDVLLVRG